MVDDADAVAHPLCLVHVVTGVDDGGSAGVQLVQIFVYHGP